MTAPITITLPNLRLKVDSLSLVTFRKSPPLVLVTDPYGRFQYAWTPTATLYRDRGNRWFVRRPHADNVPRLTPLDRAQVENRFLPEWVPLWSRLANSHDCASKLGATREILSRLAADFIDFHAHDAARFAAVYGQIPILPPDAYNAVYVRVTRGCSWNRCTFCNFYRDVNYQVLRRAEFSSHLHQLIAYWGRSYLSHRPFFLGDANALNATTGILADHLDRIRKALPEIPRLRFSAFIDAFTGTKIRAETFQTLRARGLQRLALGIESGSEELLKRVNKPLRSRAVKTITQALSEAGIGVSLIFIIGLGGRRLAAHHRTASIELVRRLNLKKGDRIYLSPLVIQPHTPAATSLGEDALAPDELAQEMALWRRALRTVQPHVQCAPYSLQRFIYM